MSYSIRDIVNKIKEGNLRLPAFQRGFVWEPEEVAFFMDSLYKGYPFGVIQLWRTREPLVTERKFGPFEIFDRDPQYPIDYVLDGQQRLTSIFGIFQTDISPVTDIYNPFKIYFDYSLENNLQESQFIAIETDDFDRNKYFPLNVLLDSRKYRQSTQGLSDETIIKLDNLQQKFQEVRIPFQVLETNNRSIVAIVFERINRKGQPLDTLQLLSAWTWSDDFDLRDKFEDLKEELQPYGFNDIGENINLLLKIISAVITQNASAESLINLNGSSVRDNFPKIINGIRGSIDFLRNNLSVQRVNNLPYDNLLVPLSVFFSIEDNANFILTDPQRITILKWFWRTCFSKRYSAGTVKNINEDIKELMKLKNNEANNFGGFSCDVDQNFFTTNQFIMNTVNTKTYILLLAQNNPKSFISGSSINLSNVLKDYNKNEFHHIFPKSFLKTVLDKNYNESCLANLCFLSKADNNKLSGNAPSIYKIELPVEHTNILNSSFCNENFLFNDNFNEFIIERANSLKQYALTFI